jgi:hypothetical protein
MTGPIHIVLGAKPTSITQFWFFHASIFLQPKPDCHPLAIGFQNCTYQAKRCNTNLRVIPESLVPITGNAGYLFQL